MKYELSKETLSGAYIYVSLFEDNQIKYGNSLNNERRRLRNSCQTKFRWLHHVQRIQEGRIPKRLRYYNSDKEGRPRTYWRLQEDIVTGHVGLGGLGVTCTPRDIWFAGSNPAEVDGLDVKILKSSGRDFKLGVPSLRFQAR